MTHINNLFGLKEFDRFLIGFDDQWNRISKFHDDLAKNIPNYPPFNIKKIGENQYTIEVAVAGFSKSEINIELDGGVLTIKGASQEDGGEYIHKGIAGRNFTRTFAIEDQIEVRGADMFNGMLKVFLERIIPEHKKPKTIEVSEGGEVPKKSKKQLLQEQQ